MGKDGGTGAYEVYGCSSWPMMKQKSRTVLVSQKAIKPVRCSRSWVVESLLDAPPTNRDPQRWKYEDLTLGYDFWKGTHDFTIGRLLFQNRQIDLSPFMEAYLLFLLLCRIPCEEWLKNLKIWKGTLWADVEEDRAEHFFVCFVLEPSLAGKLSPTLVIIIIN